MAPLSRLRALIQGDSSVAWGNSSSQRSHHPSALPSLDDGISSTPDSNEMSHSQCYAQIARGLQTSLPSTCRWLAPEDVNLLGEQPIAAGGCTDIWGATHDGRKVVVKSYCCSTSSNVAQVVEVRCSRFSPKYIADDPLQRFHNEVHVWSTLHHRGAGVVLLVGVYSTEAHPFGLVYKYLDGLDLRQHLRDKPNVGRLKLVLTPIYHLPY